MNFPHGGPSVTNNAFGDARVGFQGGIFNGDFYYQVVNENDPPDKILDSARESLSRGMPVPAEEKLRRLVDDGHGTNEIYYYWILAIVSGRSIDALKEQECDHLNVAYRECTHHAPDAWGTALPVVCDLIRCLVDETPGGDLRELDAVLGAYGRLPGVRQEEIWRHLDMVVNGEGKDRFDAWVAAQVRRQRMGRERLGRAWKFFEPGPEP